MKLKGLRLVAFKGIERFEVAFGPQATFVLGDNRQGKTSIGEAVHWILYGTDLRGNTRGLADLIRTGADRAVGQLDIVIARPGLIDQEYRIARVKLASGSTQLQLDGAPVKEAELQAILPPPAIFRAAFLPATFAGDLGATDRRRLIVGMLPAVKPADVFEQLDLDPGEVAQMAALVQAGTTAKQAREELRVARRRQDKILGAIETATANTAAPGPRPDYEAAATRVESLMAHLANTRAQLPLQRSWEVQRAALDLLQAELPALTAEASKAAAGLKDGRAAVAELRAAHVAACIAEGTAGAELTECQQHEAAHKGDKPVLAYPKTPAMPKVYDRGMDEELLTADKQPAALTGIGNLSEVRAKLKPIWQELTVLGAQASTHRKEVARAREDVVATRLVLPPLNLERLPVEPAAGGMTALQTDVTCPACSEVFAVDLKASVHDALTEKWRADVQQIEARNQTARADYEAAKQAALQDADAKRAVAQQELSEAEAAAKEATSREVALVKQEAALKTRQDELEASVLGAYQAWLMEQWAQSKQTADETHEATVSEWMTRRAALVVAAEKATDHQAATVADRARLQEELAAATATTEQREDEHSAISARLTEAQRTLPAPPTPHSADELAQREEELAAELQEAIATSAVAHEALGRWTEATTHQQAMADFIATQQEQLAAVKTRSARAARAVELLDAYPTLSVQMRAAPLRRWLDKADLVLEKVRADGGTSPAFLVTYEGRPYHRLSYSERLQAHVELSRLVRGLYKSTMPLFLDNAEGTGLRPWLTAGCQTIIAAYVPRMPLTAVHGEAAAGEAARRHLLATFPEGGGAEEQVARVGQVFAAGGQKTEGGKDDDSQV